MFLYLLHRFYLRDLGVSPRDIGFTINTGLSLFFYVDVARGRGLLALLAEA